MRYHYLQHVPFEGPAAIEDWARKRQAGLTRTALYEDEAFPGLDEFDGLFIMGGPMGVDDEAEYPWLEREKAFIGKAIESGKPVVGICLGAQLIAQVLGARVYKGPDKEIGWFPIYTTGGSGILDALPAGGFTVFHWHGDTFDLPEGAVRLAKSHGCANQAFLYGGRVLALQFHFEVTWEAAQLMVHHGREELAEDGPYIQAPEEIVLGQKEFGPRNNEVLFSILDKLMVPAGIGGTV